MADGKPTRRYSTEDKANALKRYFAGESPTKIIADLNIPKRTFYCWVESARKGRTEPATRTRESGKEDGAVGAVQVQMDDRTSAPVIVVPNFMERISIGYDYNKVQLQTAAINGYCEGMIVTADLLRDALAIEDPQDRIYATVSVLKERRAISDRIIKAFTDVTASSDEYQRIFGKLFNIEEGKE